MRHVQRIGYLNPKRQDFFERQRLSANMISQSLAIDELHGDERPIVVADVIDRTNARMIQRRRRMRLAPETLERLGIPGYIFGKELQSDRSIESGVIGLIDDPHASSPKFLGDAVVRDGLADGWRHQSAPSLGLECRFIAGR